MPELYKYIIVAVVAFLAGTFVMDALWFWKVKRMGLLRQKQKPTPEELRKLYPEYQTFMDVSTEDN